MIKKIKIDLYHIDIYLYIWDIDFLEKHIIKLQHKYNKMIDVDFNSADAVTFNIYDNIFIFSSTKDLWILIHELYHCVWKINNIIGANIENIDDEYWAYTIQYLVKKFDLKKICI